LPDSVAQKANGNLLTVSFVQDWVDLSPHRQVPLRNSMSACTEKAGRE
jgi:hypothetical protein